jgi:hypothetical protein
VGFRHITFATPDFLEKARLASLSAINIGAYSTHIFTPDQVNALNIFGKSKEIEEIDFGSRGAGYWLWKPALILNALEQMADGEFLAYTDASIRLRKQFRRFLDKPSATKINLWTLVQPKNTIMEWTDGKVLQNLGVARDSYNKPMIVGGVILIYNSKANRRLVGNWYDLCKNLDLLAPDRKNDYRPNPELIWHRHDQSLLSILTTKTPDCFQINKISQLSMNYRGLPFIVDRNQDSHLVLFFIHFEFAKRVFRKIISKFPILLRKRIKQLRTNKMISELEQKSHDKFY